MALPNPNYLMFEANKRILFVGVESTKPICMVCVRDSIKKSDDLEEKITEKVYSLEEVMELSNTPSEIFPEHIAGNTICLKEIKKFLEEAADLPLPLSRNILPPDTVGC